MIGGNTVMSNRRSKKPSRSIQRTASARVRSAGHTRNHDPRLIVAALAAALAVTIALLFWGWLWGAMGLILAIPITATMKVICDHVPSWQPVGRWLGA